MNEGDVPSCGNGDKVCFCDPCVPVSLEHFGGLGSVLVLTKRPLVDNSRITSIFKE
jgi:hypothetical protein